MFYLDFIGERIKYTEAFVGISHSLVCVGEKMELTEAYGTLVTL